MGEKQSLFSAIQGTELHTQTGNSPHSDYCESAGFSEYGEGKHRTENHRLMELCLRFGSELLFSGAETSRVEDSIVRILRAYRKEDVSAFSIPTLLLVSFKDNDGRLYTSSRRIQDSGRNFRRFERLNQLSRALCENEKSLDYFEKSLNEIVQEPVYKLQVMLIGSAFVALGFAYVFGADFRDIGIAGLIAAFSRVVFYLLEKGKANSIFNHLLNSLLIALAAELLAKVGWLANPSMVTVSALMSLVPGMLITTSIYDLVRRDYNSGISKLAEAFFIAVTLAVGSGIAVYLVR